MADATNEEFMVDFGEVIEVGGGGGTDDFNSLKNRPKYNNQTMTGDTNVPKVPQKTSELTNDSSYQTSTEVNDAINTAIGSLNIPTKTSELTNDGSDGESTYVEADNLATVATTGSYTDLTNKPTIPTVNDATLTITQNGVSKGTFTANDADDTTIELADTTYSDFTGTDGTAAGTAGLVPAPATTDAGKFLKADGTWDTAGGGGGVTVVQTTGSSTTDVMSQNATTSMVFDDPGTNKLFRVGAVATPSVDAENIFWGYPLSSSEHPQNKSINIFGQCEGEYAISLGPNAITRLANQVSIGYATLNNYSATSGIAIGSSAQCLNAYSVAIGKSAKTTRNGEFNIGAGTSGDGYNSTNYRVLGGVHDGQLAQDAVTVAQVNATIDAINTALSTNIPHIGATS